MTVIRALPQLEKLDDILVTMSEKQGFYHSKTSSLFQQSYNNLFLSLITLQMQ